MVFLFKQASIRKNLDLKQKGNYPYFSLTASSLQEIKGEMEEIGINLILCPQTNLLPERTSIWRNITQLPPDKNLPKSSILASNFALKVILEI